MDETPYPGCTEIQIDLEGVRSLRERGDSENQIDPVLTVHEI